VGLDAGLLVVLSWCGFECSTTLGSLAGSVLDARMTNMLPVYRFRNWGICDTEWLRVVRYAVSNGTVERTQIQAEADIARLCLLEPGDVSEKINIVVLRGRTRIEYKG
jgi:hypothetical protein